MNVLRARPCVRFDVIAPAGFRILWALDTAVQSCRVNLEITCWNEGHGHTDPHTLGEAVDVSVKGLSADQIEMIKGNLEMTLGPLFTVLYEVSTVPSDPTLRPIAYVNVKATGPHFHIQRRKGTTFPPESVTSPGPMVA